MILNPEQKTRCEHVLAELQFALTLPRPLAPNERDSHDITVLYPLLLEHRAFVFSLWDEALDDLKNRIDEALAPFEADPKERQYIILQVRVLSKRRSMASSSCRSRQSPVVAYDGVKLLRAMLTQLLADSLSAYAAN